MPPDVTAQIFWLKNRKPRQWRDAWQIEASVGKYLISDKPMSEADWIRERAIVIDEEATDVTPAASHALPSSGANNKKDGKR
jgi:hypothetical protein